MDFEGVLDLGRPELVAFVGAGGKKTAMQHLLEAGQSRGLQVGYTSTTHMPPPSGVPLKVSEPDSLLESLPRSEHALAFAQARVPNPERAESKVRGFDAEIIDAVYRRDRFDWLLVKADGARRREFKAPGPDEPVVPSRTTRLIPVASVQAVGKPLDEQTVHRPERVAAITGTPVGEQITPDTVAEVLGSTQGGLKSAPESATVTPLLNKADTPELRETARTILRRVLADSARLDSGLISSFKTGYCHRFEPRSERET